MVPGGDVVTYEHITIMFSLPRSRSQWWAWFFGHACLSLHDPMKEHRSPKAFTDGLKKLPDRPIFIADTAALFFHGKILDELPGVQTIYMIRNHRDVIASLRKQTGFDMSGLINEENEKLYRHAFHQDKGDRVYWGAINATEMHRLWMKVMKLPPPNDRTLLFWGEHIVDVPLMEQPFGDPDDVKSLMGYKEK